MIQFPKQLCIIGSQAHVGKTLVSSMLVLGLKGYYWKPIQCGVSPCTDTEWIKEVTNLPQAHFLDEGYRFGDSLPPHAQHTAIDIGRLMAQQHFASKEPLIIEALEGIMTPLLPHYFYIDFLKALNAPALLVIKTGENALNQALLTLEKLQERHIPLFGVLLNGPFDEILYKTIQEYFAPPEMFALDFMPTITESALLQTFEDTFMQENGSIPTLTCRNL